MKQANKYMKILLAIFWEKFYLGQFDLFRLFFTVWLGMVEIEPGHCYIGWQEIILFMITAGSLNSQDMIRVHKQSRRDFLGKHLCDGFCVDIIWFLCVENKLQQRVIWFCKASLRISGISLFECKGPWTLKTDSLIF